VQVYVEEFVRVLKWRCAKKVEDMHRLQKVKDRLWKAQAELDNLETQAKLQLGLSISVKLVINQSLLLLQEATSNTEKIRNQLLKCLQARGERESTFFDGLEFAREEIIGSHERVLLCQSVLRTEVTQLNFDDWYMHVRAEREETKNLLFERTDLGSSKKEDVNASFSLGSRRLPDLIIEATFLLLHKQLESVAFMRTEVRALTCSDVYMIAGLDLHSISAEQLELVAPLVESDVFIQGVEEFKHRTVAALRQDDVGYVHYVGNVLCVFLESLVQYSSLHNLAEQGRKRKLRLAAMPRQKPQGLRFKRTGTLGSTPLAAIGKSTTSTLLQTTGGKGNYSPPASMPPSTMNMQSSDSEAQRSDQTSERLHLLEEAERQEAESNIIRLRTELNVSERRMRQIEDRLDNAMQRKHRILVDTMRFRSAMRVGRETIK